MTLVTTLVSYRAFVPARSEGTKENTACWQVRLDSRQDDRGWLGAGIWTEGTCSRPRPHAPGSSPHCPLVARPGGATLAQGQARERQDSSRGGAGSSKSLNWSSRPSLRLADIPASLVAMCPRCTDPSGSPVLSPVPRARWLGHLESV